MKSAKEDHKSMELLKGAKIKTVQVGRSSQAKTTISLPKPKLEKLKKYAEEMGFSLSEVIAQAVEVDEFIREHINSGGVIYLQNENDDQILKIEISRR